MQKFTLFRSATLSAVASAFAMGLLVALPAPSTAQSNADLYASAKAEGKFTFWTAYDAHPAQRMQEEFAKAYPGIVLEHFEIQPEPAIQRMIAEGSAGQVNADLVHLVVPNMKAPLDRDMLEPFDWSKTDLEPALALYEGRCVEMMQVENPIIINTNLVKEGEIKSWDDLLDPKWRGKIAIEARGRGFASLYQGWGEEKTGAFIDGIKAGNPLIIKGTTPLVEAVAGGQAAVAIGPYTGLVLTAQDRGAPIDWVRVSPLPVESQFLCVPRNAPHPNAARLFALWLTTRAGQDVLWEVHRYGRVSGKVVSPLGEEVKAKGIELMVGSLDPAVSQAAQDWVGKRINQQR